MNKNVNTHFVLPYAMIYTTDLLYVYVGVYIHFLLMYRLYFYVN